MKTKIYSFLETLLNKKFTIVFAAIVLSVTILKAQIPDQLKNLPAFKLRASILSSSHKPQAHGILNDMRSSNNAPCLKAQNTLGGSGFDFGGKLIETRDGGFIVCGGTNSADGDFSVPAADGNDAYIAKYNKHRHLEWTKTFGGTGDDFFNDIAQTYDGGYILAGFTSSTDGDVSGNHGAYDVWAVKVNATGSMEWQKSLGGSGFDFGNAVVQTFYGGYAIAGFTTSNDGNVSGNHNTDGNGDAWLVELGLKGNVLYQHCYGGSGSDGFAGIVKSDFGSLILGGTTTSNDGDVSGNHGGQDAWVIKVNISGNIVWQKTVGGTGFENLNNGGIITKTTDGNVVIDGLSNSHDDDIQGKNDTVVSFLTKLNSPTGNIIWSKSFAEPKYRAGEGVFSTRDGGVVETGSSAGNGFDGSTFDVLVSKIDKNGKEEWYKKLGGSDFDGALSSGYESPDGSLNILCQTASTDGDVKNNHGGIDTWIIKLGRCGEKDADENLISANETIAVTKNILDINNPSLKLYPNPAKDVLRVEGLNTSSKTILSLFNASGKLIQQSTATGETYTYSLQKLTAGSYYIKIESDKKTTTLKFVKE
ncbi:MAG: T9SS type A sorting domain-containing protein [Bacteroidota bacterium]|nr:T9SS type A sorting domain-containing protein [Bacteroidota bacterium]